MKYAVMWLGLFAASCDEASAAMVQQRAAAAPEDAGSKLAVAPPQVLEVRVEAPAPREPVFSLTDPLDIEITMSDSDWNQLRNEGRSMPRTVDGCVEDFDYTKFQARLSMSGQTLDGVEVRKKGYVGSLSALRPSLTIEFPAHERIAGYERLTLNNNREDTTNAHACLAYRLFERAGLHAPRCGLARVRVNGVDMGYYTDVEPIKKPFLRRELGEDGGNLYELQAPNDLTVEQSSRIQLKDEGEGRDRADLMRLMAALSVPDEQLLAALTPLLDLDEYLTFWALEVLLAQWDGLNGHGANTFLYHAASDDRFHPIPWGADQAFTPLTDWDGPSTVSVFSSTRLTKRLWALPEWRAKYQARLRELLDTIWQPAQLLQDLHAIAQLTAARQDAVQLTEQFIQGQAQLLTDELNREPAPTPRTFPIARACDPAVPARSELSLHWHDVQASTGDVFALLSAVQPVPHASLMDIHLHERAITFVRGSELGATYTDANGTAFLGTIGTDVASGETILVSLALPQASLTPGDLAFHGYETYGMVSEVTPAGVHILGFIGQGSIHFEAAGHREGDAIRGTWSGMLAVQPAP